MSFVFHSTNARYVRFVSQIPRLFIVDATELENGIRKARMTTKVVGIGITENTTEGIGIATGTGDIGNVRGRIGTGPKGDIIKRMTTSMIGTAMKAKTSIARLDTRRNVHERTRRTSKTMVGMRQKLKLKLQAQRRQKNKIK